MSNWVFDKLRRFRYSDVKFEGISWENWLFEKFRKFKIESKPKLVGIFLKYGLYARFMPLREAHKSNNFGTTLKNKLNSKWR